MPTAFVFQSHVSWQEIFQRLPRPVQRLCAGNVGNTTKHLRSFRCKILYLMNYTLYRDTTAFCGKLRSSVSIRANDTGTGDLSRKPLFSTWSEFWVIGRSAGGVTCEGMCSNVLPPQVRMNVSACPTPPHPTRAYMHLPAATDKHVLPPQVHMNVITCPTPPHHTPPPRCVQNTTAF